MPAASLWVRGNLCLLSSKLPPSAGRCTWAKGQGLCVRICVFLFSDSTEDNLSDAYSQRGHFTPGPPNTKFALFKTEKAVLLKSSRKADFSIYILMFELCSEITGWTLSVYLKCMYSLLFVFLVGSALFPLDSASVSDSHLASAVCEKLFTAMASGSPEKQRLLKRTCSYLDEALLHFNLYVLKLINIL